MNKELYKVVYYLVEKEMNETGNLLYSLASMYFESRNHELLTKELATCYTESMEGCEHFNVTVSEFMIALVDMIHE